jgi:hypothetical protein
LLRDQQTHEGRGQDSEPAKTILAKGLFFSPPDKLGSFSQITILVTYVMLAVFTDLSSSSAADEFTYGDHGAAEHRI